MTLKKICFVLATWLSINLNPISAQIISGAGTGSGPHLEKNHGAIQLIAEGKPFLMVAGELHNSTSSTKAYFDEALKNVKQLNVNTMIASISWEQLEPQENKFDFTMLDHIIKRAHENNLKLVLLWFGSWKNGESSYAPLWVKKDTKRFFRVKDKSGKEMTAISPFCREAMLADAKAFATMMKRIKEKDQNKDVLMVQVENEPGAFTNIDRSKEALAAYRFQVPEELLHYLQKNKDNLESYLKKPWKANGAKIKGNWADLFGEKDLVAQHIFMTWYYARYLNEVAEQGKAVYNLPMYANAWLIQFPGELPGKFPNGGPVSELMDVYKAAAPSIDFISPDIYLPNFKEICSDYYRPAKNNPLFVPECERTNPGKAFYVLAENNGLGFSPFGIESIAADLSYGLSNLVLEELLPLISQYQGSNKMRGFLQEANEDSTLIDIGRYRLKIKYTSKERKSYGLIIQTGEADFLIAGTDCQVYFSSEDEKTSTNIAAVFEGKFTDGKWETTRQLNGDETWHNAALLVEGRSYSISNDNDHRSIRQVLAPIPVLNRELESGLQIKQVKSPGVYKVKLYGL